MRLAVAQIDVAFADPQANAERLESVLCREAAGCDLVVFPEAFLTGYCVASPEEAARIAIEVGGGPDGEVIDAHPAVRTVKEAARRSGAHVVVGFAGQDAEGLYNGALLVEPSGRTRRYVKTHLPDLGFDKFARPGDALPVFETAIGRIGVLVCFDLRYPEAARTLALKGADLIVLPTNWPVGAHAGPDFIAPARAAENKVFVATCNRVGTENGFDFIGRSAVYDVFGRTVTGAGAEETVLLADLDLSEARDKRTVVRPGEYEIDVTGRRRPELYWVEGEASA